MGPEIPKTSEEEIPTLVDLDPPSPPPEAYPEDMWEEDTAVDLIFDLT